MADQTGDMFDAAVLEAASGYAWCEDEALLRTMAEGTLDATVAELETKAGVLTAELERRQAEHPPMVVGRLRVRPYAPADGPRLAEREIEAILDDEGYGWLEDAALVRRLLWQDAQGERGRLRDWANRLRCELDARRVKRLVLAGVGHDGVRYYEQGEDKPLLAFTRGRLAETEHWEVPAMDGEDA